MLKMKFLFPFFFFFTFLLGLTTAGQESIQFVKLDEIISSGVFPAISGSDLPVAVSVTDAELPEVSSSVLMAESWLRTFVLAHYPSTKITTIVVGNSSLCSTKNQDTNTLQFVLLSLKNLFYSLTRWGLENQIKVSTLFPKDCFHSQEESIQNMVKLVIEFIQSTNSTLTLKLTENVISLHETENFISTHMNKFGFLKLHKVNLITSVTNQRNPISRKLSSFMELNEYEPFFTSEPPLPSDLATPPLPPESQIASPPHWSFAAAPESPPFVVPASPPMGFSLPPCNPDQNAGAPFPQTGSVQKQWCVAKPSVPTEILQQAMDYACGDGGADCREISAEGSCFHPDTLVAHASYAFNSYWQKNKRNGGTCSFGGTAMIISSDPSFHHCRFVLS
ncbi:glucan endo-1,3-beta-glucosidase 1 isoform X2 [Benincasa hispida]|uniref:glucan endo-1,3-beta-glucosidase 1 isoform X2 n=1 Tax=Benincasa hispida TaxID=102211 RepID=UPI0018FF7207|nr:glucan endo-1,3-beta-glucosidase 1 isoform X2 [Benincasa hispida]